MELLERLEQRLEEMVNKIKSLEEENQLLKMELEEARHKRDAVLARIDGLLKRVQEEIE